MLACSLGAGAVWYGNGTDAALMNSISAPENEFATRAADFISDYTSDLTLAIPLSLSLWTLGAACRRSRWRRLGLACLMATAMAGLTVTAVKHATGRPRPKSAEAFPKPLYGPTSVSKLHSFPSGHTGTSTATGVSLMAAGPFMVVPGIAYAATVGWCRIQLRKHYPLDVVGGAAIGIVYGACFASAVPGSVIRLRRRKRRRSKNS